MPPHAHIQPHDEHSSKSAISGDCQAEGKAERLELARSVDTAWRAERCRMYQRRIDRAYRWEMKGHHWFHTPDEGMWYVILGTVAAGLWLAPGRDEDLTLLVFGVLLALRPVLGACLLGATRLGRHFWLRSARRANIEVTNPGNVPLWGTD